MNIQLLHEVQGLRTYVVALATGEDPADELLAFAEETGVTAAELTGIGAFSTATLGWFDIDAKDYRRIDVDEQAEVLSLTGNVARTDEGETKIHAHLVLGKADGAALGGHLLSARVRPTLEVMVTESPTELQRTVDPETDLPLLRRHGR